MKAAYVSMRKKHVAVWNIVLLAIRGYLLPWWRTELLCMFQEVVQKLHS